MNIFIPKCLPPLDHVLNHCETSDLLFTALRYLVSAFTLRNYALKTQKHKNDLGWQNNVSKNIRYSVLYFGTKRSNLLKNEFQSHFIDRFTVKTIMICMKFRISFSFIKANWKLGNIHCYTVPEWMSYFKMTYMFPV